MLTRSYVYTAAHPTCNRSLTITTAVPTTTMTGSPKGMRKGPGRPRLSRMPL